MMKAKYKIGDVVHFRTSNLTAVIKDVDEFTYSIEYILSHSRSIYSNRHTINWMNEHAFKMDI